MTPALLLYRDGSGGWRGLRRDGESTSAVDLPLAAREPALIVMPGEELLLTDVEPPVRNAKQIAQALPYLLEEQLAEEVERLHFVRGRWNGGRVAVCVVARERIDAVLAEVRECNVDPTALVPEPLLLPREEGTWSLHLLQGRAVVRSGDEQGFVSDVGALEAFLHLALEQAAAPPEAIVLSREVEKLPVPEFLSRLPGGLVDGGAREHLAHTPPASLPLDLLSGNYGRADRLVALARPWRYAAVAILVCLGVASGFLAWEVARFTREVDTVRADMEGLYRRAFPNARNVVDPVAQMRHHLQVSSAGEDGARFLRLLNEVGKAIKQVDGLELGSLRYRAGELDLQLTARSVEALEGLRGLLSGVGLEAEVAAANIEKDEVRGRMRIRGVAR